MARLTKFDIEAAREIDVRVLIERDLGPPDRPGRKYSIWWCPFHQESTIGGFKVYKSGYKCFSCGKTGDAISWLTDYRNMEFVDAVKSLNSNLTSSEIVELAKRRVHQAEIQLEQKIAEAQRALSDLRAARTWETYYMNVINDQTVRHLWNKRGLSDDFINFWLLGYRPDVFVYSAGQKYVVPALTFPVWGYKWTVYNVKYRLQEVPDKVSKYLQEMSGITGAPFVCNPDKNNGNLLLVEGEIKAMVVFQMFDNPDRQVIGLPGTYIPDEYKSVFSEYDDIVVCLDPDAYYPRGGEQPGINRVIADLGKSRIRVLRIPMKIDDAINAGALSKSRLSYMMTMARRV